MAGSSAAFRPLRGVRVLDFSSTLAGPFAGMILAQLGADVVKIEALQGDDSRKWAPAVADGSVTYAHVNAGKRGIALDLSKPAALQVALDLAARSDVLLQSMRPGVAERIGIGEAALRSRNPDILYYSLNGYGSGPMGNSLPGYDPLVQASSGIMLMNGYDDMPLVRCAPSVVDLATGQWIAIAVMGAVLARRDGQTIRSIETALIDSAFSMVPYQATTARMTGKRPKKSGSGNPMVSPNQAYKARDASIMITALNQRLWDRTATALGAPELVDDARFRTVANRTENSAILERVIEDILAQEDADVWVERFLAAGVPVARVSGLEEAARSEMAAERQTFSELDGLPLVRLPWLIDGAPLPWTRPAPHLGEHTAELLRELGYDEAGIAELENSGAVALYNPA